MLSRDNFGDISSKFAEYMFTFTELSLNLTHVSYKIYDLVPICHVQQIHEISKSMFSSLIAN